jgi:hypothetical protein
MDQEIERLGELTTLLYPWDENGKQWDLSLQFPSIRIPLHPFVNMGKCLKSIAYRNLLQNATSSANLRTGKAEDMRMKAADYTSWLKRRELTHEEAGRALGLSRATSSRYASGTTPIPKVVELAIEALEARWRGGGRKSR